MRLSLHQLKWGLFHLLEGDFISQYARTYGEWSEIEVQFFHKILTESSNVIEVGSNIGMHTIPIAKKATQGKIFCFEPQRIIFQLLCSNLMLNQLSHVYTYQQGVSHKNEQIEIATSDYNTPWNYGSFSLNQGFNTEGNFQGVINKEKIQIITLDSHPEIQQLTHLALLKIDAEGFDLNVLKGAKQTIQTHQPVIFIEAHPHQAKKLLEYLAQLDYRCYWFVSARYQADNYFHQPKSLDGHDFNLACFPKNQQSCLPEQLRASPTHIPEQFSVIQNL
ncbi:FkbM family methyltransferase [Necropsobacter massiliensis]|uniref:FkbM family methyltransferase n=1 Tax=Necropsobacter massiliensis TaxID=1400001 RepID=UPI0005963173|nr:FkbM family methyltransferase [Necropsobacter massiliensis]